MLKCVIFCEFDLKKGPVLRYQYPVYVNKEQFNTMSDILIPLPELCGKLITAHIDERDFVVGQPIIIVNDKYERQKIEFNLAFVLPNEEYQRLPLYESFIRKIAMHLTVLETFEDFLSNDLKKAKLEGVCREIFTKLSDGSSHCCISFEPFNILTLNYEKKELLPPPLIEDWHVPVPLADLEVYKTLVTDLVILKVLSCIDGRKYVKVISNELNLSQNNTRLCLKYLFFQGLIDFIDLFQVANVYRITEKVHLLLHGLAEESVRHLGKGKEIDEFLIFNLYCTLSDRSISDFLEENPEVLFTVDIELLIAYGVLRGVIRRVHKYCVMVDSAHVDKENYLKNAEKIVEMEKYGMLKGNTCMDEIVTHFETQQRSVEGVVKDISLFFYK